MKLVSTHVFPRALAPSHTHTHTHPCHTGSCCAGSSLSWLWYRCDLLESRPPHILYSSVVHWPCSPRHRGLRGCNWSLTPPSPHTHLAVVIEGKWRREWVGDGDKGDDKQRERRGGTWWRRQECLKMRHHLHTHSKKHRKEWVGGGGHWRLGRISLASPPVPACCAPCSFYLITAYPGWSI